MLSRAPLPAILPAMEQGHASVGSGGSSIDPTIRRYRSDDLADWVALRAAIEGRGPTVDEARHVEDSWRHELFYRDRVVAATRDRLVGWGQVAHVPWQFHPHRYALDLGTHPDSRQRGIGSRVLEALVASLVRRGAAAVRARAVESDASTVLFLEHRGFREVWRHIPARLDLHSRRDDLGSHEPRGIRLTTLAKELTSGRAVLPALYGLAVRTNADQPQLDPTTPPPLEQFARDVTDEPHAIPEAFFLAFDGARLVGLSSLERLPGTNEGVETGYTAVDSEYRGRGIARALKLRTIEWAADQGYRYIETDTNAGNEPMIGLNRSLGFEPEPARITYELVLSAGGTVAESDSRSG